MTKKIHIHLRQDKITSSRMCSYIDRLYSLPLKHAELKIKWVQEQKAFFVDLKGKHAITDKSIVELGHKIPLEVARDSTCECGSALKLGSYSVISENDDFTFQGEFYCSKCKEEMLAQKSGLGGCIRYCLDKFPTFC